MLCHVALADGLQGVSVSRFGMLHQVHHRIAATLSSAQPSSGLTALILCPEPVCFDESRGYS